ncbi:MAG: hypothetical protein WA919_11250, partial [Coleofasciculaceae cyanobacterium]
WLAHLETHALDFTASFRQLAEQLAPDATPRFGEFEHAWRARLATQPQSSEELQTRMRSVNPLFIARNHQVERAIAGAIEGDFRVFNTLQRVLKKPFDEQPEFAEFAVPPQPEERVQETFCGT